MSKRVARQIAIFLSLSGLVACASPEVVEVNKIGDDQLTCSQLKDQIAEADNFERKARAERGVTGTNVAAAVLFFPALLVTYANTDEAIDAARDRKQKLVRLAEKKNCRA